MLQEFVNTGFSNDTYNIIALDPERNWVVRIIPITTENLCLLRELLQAGLNTLSALSDGTGTDCGPIYFRRHHLACLNSFVKASVDIQIRSVRAQHRWNVSINPSRRFC